MVEEEVEAFAVRAGLGAQLEAGPDDEAEETREASVADDDEEGCDDEDVGRSLEGDHGVRCEREAEVVECGLGGVDGPGKN